MTEKQKENKCVKNLVEQMKLLLEAIFIERVHEADTAHIYKWGQKASMEQRQTAIATLFSECEIELELFHNSDGFHPPELLSLLRGASEAGLLSFNVEELKGLITKVSQIELSALKAPNSPGLIL